MSISTIARVWLRLILAGMMALVVLVWIYAWTDRSTATDFSLVYRIGFGISAGFLAYGIVRPKLRNTVHLLLPLNVLALVRIIDFAQDWWWTPEPFEPLDPIDRFFLGSIGWGFILLLTLLVYLLEEVIEYLSRATCENAYEGCLLRKPYQEL